MRYVSAPLTGGLTGVVRVPGDKSISHRAVLFAAMASGTSRLTGVLDSDDVRSTIRAVEDLGATVSVVQGERGLDVTVDGWGSAGPHQPDAAIDCGNSGTTCRLLMGVLAGYDIAVRLTGDESLSARPMRRVAEPLGAMGAAIGLSDAGTLPALLTGAPLQGCRHDLAVASAQVKSALLLAGLRAEGTTTVCEPAPSRDHTERMLPAFGARVARTAAGCAAVDGPQSLVRADVDVPGDPSSAAFMACAAALVPGSDVLLAGVSLNPARTGFLRVLERMGADVRVADGPEMCGEPVGDIRVRYRPGLAGAVVPAEEIPSLIDEVPVLAVIASFAAGETRFAGAGELRVKESDRFAAIVDALNALGGCARADGDDLVVEGPRVLGGGTVDSLGDHRLAMAFAVAGLASVFPVTIERFEAVSVSYPCFPEDLERLATGAGRP